MKPLSRLFMLVTTLLLISCGDSSEISKTDNLFKFKDYITHNTHGLQSIASPIEIGLFQPLENFEIDQELPSEYLKIKPKADGKLLIQNGRTLIFQPSNYLKPDTEYSITLRLDRLYPGVSAEFETYTFVFKTIKPNFKIELGHLQSYDKQWQYVTGNIETSDLVDLETIKKLVKATQEKDDLVFKWIQAEGTGRFFNFTIDSIKRKEEDGKIEISWDGKAIKSDFKGINHFPIPGKNNFKVVDIESDYDPQSALSINFSDPLAANQNFNGLVSLENAEELRFEVDGNVLHVYPSNRIVGNVRLTLFNGLKNNEGYALKTEFSELVSFEQLKPSLQLISKGVILPNSKETPLYFKAVNLSAVDVRIIQIYENNMLQFLQGSNLDDQSNYNLRRVGRRINKKTIQLTDKAIGDDGVWKAYGLNLSDYFRTDPGALYRVELSFKKEYANFDCEAPQENTAADEDEYYDYDVAYDNLEEEQLEEQYWNNEIYNYRRYRYNWREQDNPCHEAYYSEDKMIFTNVLGSDLGIIAKKGNNLSYHFAASNLLSAKPMAGVRVNLYNFQQQLVGSTITNPEGLCIYDSKKHIAFAIAQKGKNFAYVKLEDGNALSMSNFDVAGKTLQKGLKGFIYTERGVYRPGDTIHLSFALNDNNNPLPKNHPVRMEVTDARGKLVQRATQNQGVNGFYYFPITTDQQAPTGNWNATIHVGGASFSKNIKVATIKPNRLKLEVTFDSPILNANEPLKGTAKVNWLHGAVARNLDIEMQATITGASAAFEDYKQYQFNDPVRSFSEVELPILDATLSSEGTAPIDKKIELGSNAPGMLQATFLTKVFEGGGDFSIDVFSKKLAPYDYFVGLKSPKPHRYGSYYTDEKTTFDIVSVDPEGKVAGNRAIDVEVFKIEWRWWWNRGSDNLSRYENSTVHKPFKSFSLKTSANGKASFDLNIPEEEGGRYLIRVKDKASGHATGRITYFYRNWWKRPLDGNTESTKMLLFSTSKESYDVGEEVAISFPSSAGGRALVSVENGTEVLTTQWVETSAEETKLSIPLSKEMTPNVYINIALLQPHENSLNDLPIRLYGVVPVQVNDPSTILAPKIEMPKVLKPDSNYSVKVSEENNKGMTYTIAVVDEGLLDLTRFATPNIHEAFYSREALGVKTFDIYDYVIGAYSGSVENIYAVGGGGDAAAAKNRKADRFKPVVSFIGPFELKAGEQRSHKLHMPNYVGSVRTMLVAGNPTTAAYGKTDVQTPVRQPLMVLASLPRKLSPGETIKLPVTVFAMDKKVTNATIKVNSSGGLKPLEGNSKTISFSQPGEQIVNFEFEIVPGTPIEQLEVIANGGGETASYSVEVDIENPNPISQSNQTLTLNGNESKTIDFETFGVEGSNSSIIEFSTLPPMDIEKRLGYLLRYPHGCIEQTTSAAFPQLFLEDILDLTFDRKKEINKHMEAAIKRIGHFQRSNGGLSYWPGERNTDDWGTTYAGHFMLEAKQKGYNLPITFLSNWLRYQKTAARQWRSSSTSYNSSLTQAYRLYTLALAQQPELAAMNRLKESGNLSNDAKWRLAAAYALSGKPKVAAEIAKTANLDFQIANYNSYTYGSPFRNKAMALETMVILGDTKQRELSISLAKELSSQRWFSTQETAYGLLALSKMVKKNGGKSLDLSYTIAGKTQAIKTERSIAQRSLPIRIGENSVTVQSKGNNTLYATLVLNGKLPLGKELAERNNLVIQSSYTDAKGNAIPIEKIRQGTEIFAKVVVTNSTSNYVDNIALTKIFPGGWEIVNTSFTSLGGGAQSNARYTDIRDDRVNFYFDLKARESKSFTVRLNASYLGKYYLPGTQVEAMYDRNYFARNQGIWVNIDR